ncbi:hypothetical protein THIX_60083 [Thiomonas sp. X19]|nr:hypothetical protein THIX_60083 [Thiomonas sp. X19]
MPAWLLLVEAVRLGTAAAHAGTKASLSWGAFAATAAAHLAIHPGAGNQVLQTTLAQARMGLMLSDEHLHRRG